MLLINKRQWFNNKHLGAETLFELFHFFKLWVLLLIFLVNIKFIFSVRKYSIVSKITKISVLTFLKQTPQATGIQMTLWLVGSRVLPIFRQTPIFLIAHVWYIKIQVFLVFFLYLVWFSLCSSLFWELRDDEIEKNKAILFAKLPRVTFKFWCIERGLLQG